MKTAEEKVQLAKDVALRALSARDFTRKELLELLLQKRTSAATAEAALLELEDLGLLDDRRVAESHLRQRLSESAISKSLLEAELLERGIESGLAQTVLHELLNDYDDSAEALELARDQVRRSPARLSPDAVRRRTFAYLARRGFDEEVAREAVERAAEEYLGRP